MNLLSIEERTVSYDTGNVFTSEKLQNMTGEIVKSTGKIQIAIHDITRAYFWLLAPRKWCFALIFSVLNVFTTNTIAPEQWCSALIFPILKAFTTSTYIVVKIEASTFSIYSGSCLIIPWIMRPPAFCIHFGLKRSFKESKNPENKSRPWLINPLLPRELFFLFRQVLRYDVNDSWRLRRSPKTRETTILRENKIETKRFALSADQIRSSFLSARFRWFSVDCGKVIVKSRRPDKTLTEKVKLLALYNTFLNNLSQYCACEELGMLRGLLQSLLKNKAELCQKKEDGQDTPSRKLRKRRKGPGHRTAVFDWFNFMRTKNSPFNKLILMQEGNQIA